MDLYQQYLAGTILKPCIEETNCIISPEELHDLTQNVGLEFASVSRAALKLNSSLIARSVVKGQGGLMHTLDTKQHVREGNNN